MSDTTAINYDALLKRGARVNVNDYPHQTEIILAQMAAAIRALRAELGATHSGLKDPATVLVNMMRGHIANPHADTAKRNDELCAENDRLRAALAESEREVAVYRDWHDDVMAKCRANDFFDGYGNTMRLTQAMAAQEKAPADRAGYIFETIHDKWEKANG